MATKGRQLLLDLLKDEGVDVIFGNPGTTELPLLDALCADDRFRYVLGLQEAAVMAMADGYARATQRLAVVNLHAAPGLGNAMGMLYDAAKAGAPVVVTAGQQALGFGLTEPILYADLPQLARPLVKWAAEVPSVADLSRMVHRAAKVALAPPTGPVFLSLPTDVLNASVAVRTSRPTRVAAAVSGDPDAIRATADLLAAARSPIIVAGDSVVQSGAEAELAALAERLGCAVHIECEPTTLPFAPAHPLYGGVFARTAKPIRAMLETHDLLLSVGADLFTFSKPDVDPLPPDLTIVHIDTDPWQLGKNFAADQAILGSPKATLPLLVEALATRMDPAARRLAAERARTTAAQHDEARAALVARAEREAADRPLKPLPVMRTIAAGLPADAVVVQEALSSTPGLVQFLRLGRRNSYFATRGGGIGWGIAAAVGVKLARPAQPVVALIGDGSAMYTIQALWTAAHEKLAIVFIVLNNRSYRILKQNMITARGATNAEQRFLAMDLVDPMIDYPGLARSMGIDAVAVDTLDGLSAQIAEKLAGDRPVLIDVALDGSV